MYSLKTKQKNTCKNTDCDKKIKPSPKDGFGNLFVDV